MRERIRAALVNSGFDYPFAHIVVHLPGFPPRRRLYAEMDLAIAAALLSASGQLVWTGLPRVALVSELALDGSTRPIGGAQPMVERSAADGDEMIIVPAGCAVEATGAGEGAVVGIESLSQLPAIASRHWQLTQRFSDASGSTNSARSAPRSGGRPSYGGRS